MKLTTLALAISFICASIFAGAPTTLNDFFLPGSQPLESGNIEKSDGCNCHEGYDTAVEPMFNWKGSMMSQAGRDPLFFAAVAIARQDAPESPDLCFRCHLPKGWLEGRSIPTDGSAFIEEDRDGVNCHFCHKMIEPAAAGTNPHPGDANYTSGTYPADSIYLSSMSVVPSHSADGMYIVDSIDFRRGPYSDPAAPHDWYYSPFHRQSSLCGTCHDVSNPVFSRAPGGDYVPNTFDSASPSHSPYDLFPVERTFSEWLHSDYNSAAGVYAPQFGGNSDTVRTCQDCHMRDVTGRGCNQGNAPVRSDLGLHDMTGGNTFIPTIIDKAFPDDKWDPVALDSGIVRATRMLQLAASMALGSAVIGGNHNVSVTVTNETGHKLPSGYPEGRRIWLNIQAYNAGDSLIYESGAYDTTTGVLTHDTDAKVYEIKPGISNSLAPIVGETAGPSFHFVLNDSIYYDNRIPPRGFTNAAFDSIQSPPVGYTYADGQYWDVTDYLIPGSAAKVVVTLFYQTTSKEYIEFLQLENTTDHWGDSLYSWWDNNGKSAPVTMNKDSLLLTPQVGNSDPVLAEIGPRTIDEFTLLSFNVTATDADGDNIQLYTTTPLPTGANFVDSGTGIGTFEWTPTYEQSGTYPVTFYAEDDSGAVDSEVVSITVNNVNRPPNLDPIAAPFVDENQLLTFDVVMHDPDGNYANITVDPLPTGATFTYHADTTATFSWTPTYDQAGNYPVDFIAHDDSAATDTQSVTITVNNVNRAPTIAPAGPYAVTEADTVEFLLTSSDPDGESLVYTATGIPPGAIFEDSTNGVARFYWETTVGDAGSHALTVIVSDGSLADTLIVSILITQQGGCCIGIRGNVNGDGTESIDIADLTYLVAYMFKSGAAPICTEEADVNGDGGLDIADLTYLVTYMFKAGAEPVTCIAASAGEPALKDRD